MKHWSRLLAAAIVWCLPWSVAVGDEAGLERLRTRLAAGVLRWGGDAEGGAPYQVYDPNAVGGVIGFEVELANALGEQLSAMIERPLAARFVQYEWVSLPLGLEKGDFDVIISGLEITPENRQTLLLSRAYYIYAQQLVTRRDDDRIASLDDCADRLVGTLDGSAAKEILLAAGVADRNLVLFEGQVEPYLDLELGRLDAVLLDVPIAEFYARTKATLKFVGPPLGQGGYAVAARKQDRDLIEAVDAALGRLMESGRLREIYRRWHLYNADQAELAQGARRNEELEGLGFDEAGRMRSELAVTPAGAVDRELISQLATQWTFGRYAPVLLAASGMTVLLTVTSMVLAVVLGLIVCLARLYGPWPVRAAALAYIELFRGIPLLLLLFFLYFGLAGYGVQMPAVATAILGFGINYAAYEAEIYRSAILAVPKGQWEAARALGMSERQTFGRIIFPQALRTALGPMTNDFVALFKDTSLVSVIAVRELTKEYLILSRSTLKFVELGLLTAALYLAMSVPLGYLSRYLESRWGAPR